MPDFKCSYILKYSEIVSLKRDHPSYIYKTLVEGISFIRAKLLYLHVICLSNEEIYTFDKFSCDGNYQLHFLL